MAVGAAHLRKQIVAQDGANINYRSAEGTSALRHDASSGLGQPSDMEGNCEYVQEVWTTDKGRYSSFELSLRLTLRRRQMKVSKCHEEPRTKADPLVRPKDIERQYY
jgi:hypothetical protein